MRAPEVKRLCSRAVETVTMNLTPRSQLLRLCLRTRQWGRRTHFLLLPSRPWLAAADSALFAGTTHSQIGQCACFVVAPYPKMTSGFLAASTHKDRAQLLPSLHTKTRFAR